VLQRRSNHDTFKIYRVDADGEAMLAERLKVDDVPTLLVVERKRVSARLEQPRGCRDIEQFCVRGLVSGPQPPAGGGRPCRA
jgi:hypothetical protein